MKTKKPPASATLPGLKMFCELEPLRIIEGNLLFMINFIDTFTFMNGKYEVRLPWRDE